MLYKLSAFADEIADDFDQQIEVLQQNGVDHIELRGVWGKNVLDLTPVEVRQLRNRAAAAGIAFSAIGSPIGKAPIDADFQPQLDALKRAFDIAEQLDVPFIRIFSFYPPAGTDPNAYRQPVVDRLTQMVSLAEEAGRVLVHENEKDIYGDTGARCLDLFKQIASPAFAAIFDFANFVQCGQRPYTDAWKLLREQVVYFHIKDARLTDGSVVPAGAGDGDVQQILAEAFADGFNGFLSLEPHLSLATAQYGRTSPELFATAVQSLQNLLQTLTE